MHASCCARQARSSSCCCWAWHTKQLPHLHMRASLLHVWCFEWGLRSLCLCRECGPAHSCCAFRSVPFALQNRVCWIVGPDCRQGVCCLGVGVFGSCCAGCKPCLDCPTAGFTSSCNCPISFPCGLNGALCWRMSAHHVVISTTSSAAAQMSFPSVDLQPGDPLAGLRQMGNAHVSPTSFCLHVLSQCIVECQPVGHGHGPSNGPCLATSAHHHSFGPSCSTFESVTT